MTEHTRTPSGPPAGWYNDPGGNNTLRWWDGSRWGEQTQARPGYGIDQPPQEYRPDYGIEQAPRENGHTPAHHGQSPRRKRRRVFMWVFLAVQALFVLWLVVGLATTHTGATPAQIAQLCGKGQWQGLFQSYHDCVVHGGHGLQEAGNLGKGIGIALIIVLWAVVDIILGITYGVYRLATRSR
jgi:Protein of unknown function (DUF2510)